MKRSIQVPSVDLGMLQAEMEASSKRLKAAQRAKQKADQEFEEALSAHERSRVALNSAVNTVKAQTTVPNLYAA